MPKFTIKDIPESNLTNNELKNYYKERKKVIKSAYPNFNFTDLDLIFEIACNNRDLFTAKNIDNNSKSWKSYINQWVTTYCSAVKNLPSKKMATKKSSCNDPIVKTMIKVAQDIDDKKTLSQIGVHNLCMSAENVLGNLLEEFIAEKIRDYGWIWCAGNTLKSIDFCNKAGTILLQVKNKNNSENSSSNKIREGTTIKHWYRLSTSKKGGKITPKFKWDKLNEIINSNLPKGKRAINLSEESFQEYIINVVRSNPNIITKE